MYKCKEKTLRNSKVRFHFLGLNINIFLNQNWNSLTVDNQLKQLHLGHYVYGQ